MKGRVKRMLIVPVALVGFVVFAYSLFSPNRPENLRIPVTLQGALDGNGALHDIRIVIEGHSIPCTWTRQDVYCTLHEPHVQALIQKAKSK